MPDSDAPTFEQALLELEGIVRELESGEVGLADALVRYERGITLLQRCHGLLEGAERRIELLTGVTADGKAIVKPLEVQPAGTLDEKAQSRSRRRTHSDPAPTVPPTPPEPTEWVDEPGRLF